MEFHHVDVADGGLLIERLSGAPVIELRLQRLGDVDEEVVAARGLASLVQLGLPPSHSLVRFFGEPLDVRSVAPSKTGVTA